MRLQLFNTPVDCIDMSGAVERVAEMIAGDRVHTIMAVNPEKVIRARKDRKLRAWLNSASLAIPDGIGVVAAARWLAGKPISRVPGSELMPEICALAAREGYRVYLYGARPSTLEAVVANLHSRYPGLNIVGQQHGYLTDSQMPELIADINHTKAQIVFVALGSPRQELWMERYLDQMDSVRVVQGVGGTFDVIAGTVKRAPKLFIRLHCEWLYRLLSDPRRLFRQSALPLFAALVMLGLIKKGLRFEP